MRVRWSVHRTGDVYVNAKDLMAHLKSEHTESASDDTKEFIEYLIRSILSLHDAGKGRKKG